MSIVVQWPSAPWGPKDSGTFRGLTGRDHSIGAVARPSGRVDAWRFLQPFLNGIGSAELVVASLLAAVLWLPSLVGGRAWTPTLLFVAVLAVYTIVRRRALPPIPVPLLLYLAVYIVATAHGRTFHLSDLKEGYFIRPLTALAVAAVVTSPLQRLRALALVVLFAASQIPVTCVQAIRNLASYGRGSVSAGAEDRVTGLLGTSNEKPLTLMAIAACTIVAGAWFRGAIGPRWALLLGSGLVAIGAFSSTRATAIFVVAAGGAMVAAACVALWPHPPTGRLVALGVSTLVAAVGVLGLTWVLYRDAFNGALAKEKAEARQGAVAVGQGSGVGGQRQRGVGGSLHAAPGEVVVDQGDNIVACNLGAHTHGNPCLPGRLEQLKLAVRLSVRDGAGVALVGRGPGSSSVAEQATQISAPRRTGLTWLGKILTETGWLGVAAFLGLLVWLVVLGWKLCRRRDAATADGVLGAALPGIAALTAVGAAYITVLTIRGCATVFWVLVGIAISAAYQGRGWRLGSRRSGT